MKTWIFSDMYIFQNVRWKILIKVDGYAYTDVQFNTVQY